ncbi:MAG: ATP-dependent DNA helicase RecG [Candidatus Curtissbacteria bacterium]|nr:ATP-dependent DNA helicase RecG [Candidatus Curtissbacteria bacterium]
MGPKTPISHLPGIGQYYSYKLKHLEIETIEDLVYHFPFRYDDFSQLSQIQNLIPGEKTSIQGTVWQIRNIRTRNGKFITTATVADQTGTVEVIWFNQPYLTKNIEAGTPISLSGKVELDGHKFKLISPQYEIIRNGSQLSAVSSQPETIHTGRLVPIYPETEGITSKWLRAKIARYLPEYLKGQNDFMPQEILQRQKLTDIETALTKIHFPENIDEVKLARTRLGFDELFTAQFIAAHRKKQWQSKSVAPQMKVEKEKVQGFIKSLPFKLTGAQIRSLDEILKDMQGKIPANRLLEGDVGSGKTVVAAAAAYISHLNGYEVLVAAPTEILAFQHEKTLTLLLSPYNIKVGIWTGSKKAKGEVTCGTHALLSTFKREKQIGLVVVDEQHRFGVAQRAKLFLQDSKKLTPHLLTMTATPIPRTLALTLYGDLDLSVLDEMPLGRQKISTFVVPNKKRLDAYKFIEKQIKEGQQAFILTPFVEPSETMQTVKAATVEFEKLKSHFSKNVKLGLLHGRLKSREKETVINDFKSGKIHILVTTPVVEVGIDVPNATVMMVESADRFGLAQLHQLRGRVGRGEHKSYCLLFTDSQSQMSQKRLKSMEKVHVGFELAQIDLRMRGPGEIFGLNQSGFTNLKIADLSDEVLISCAQTEAKRLLEKDPNLKKYALLKEKINTQQLEYIQPN